MASTEVYLTRAAVTLSILLVLLLTVLALLSVFGGDEGQGEPVDEVPGDRPTAYPGQQYVFDDAEEALTIGCVPTVGNTDVYVVSITNQSERVVDYVVVAELVAEAGNPVEAMAEITDLQPAEAREVVLVPDRAIDGIEDCRITAIQGDRRVLLANS